MPLDFGIKLTIEGQEVLTNTTPEHHSIWSKYKNLKIMDDPGTWPTSVTITSGNYNNSYTITHNLGYVPLYDLYFKDQDNRMVHIPGKSLDTYGTRGRIISESTTAIVVRLGRPSATYPTNVTYSVYHFVYVDPQVVADY